MNDELEAAKAKHKQRVDRRAKFLSTLTPKQREVRDDYIGWLRWWRKKYAKLVVDIINNKTLIRRQGHNNALSLKWAVRRLDEQRREARMMLLARQAGKVDHQMKMEAKPTKRAA